MHRAHSVDLTQGILWKQMLRFAIPLLLSNLFQLFYNTADAVIVGNAIGTSALAAVGAGGQLVSVVVGFSVGFSTGASVVVARYFGARNPEKIGKTVHTAFTMGFLGSLALTILCEILVPPVLRLIHTPEGVFGEAVLYLRLYFLGLVPLLLYNIGAGILRGVGDSFRPLLFLVATCAANVGLDLLFVVVFRWGVAGAALATVLAQAVACLLVIYTLICSRESYRLEGKKLGIDRQILKEIVSIGVPTGLQSVVAGLSRIVIQSKVNLFGELAMAGTVAYTRVDSFQALPIDAMCMTTTTLISQNLGAQDEQRARKGIRFGLWFCAVFALVSGGAIFAFAPQILRMFTADAGAIAYGVRMASVMATFYMLCALSSGMSAVIRGTGDARNPMLISMMNLCIFRIIWCSLILFVWSDILAVYVSYPISWGLDLFCLVLYYKKRCPLGKTKRV